MELVGEHSNIILVSDQFKTFAQRGLMKDEFHYTQRGYNIVGEEAGGTAGRFIKAYLAEDV